MNSWLYFDAIKTKIMETKQHICPVWVGYFMLSPLRSILQNPEKLLNSYINKGMNILEIGPAMGFFSIPMAKMTGPNGKVICVDIQKNMLKKLDIRAQSKQVNSIIETRLANNHSFHINDLEKKIDFTLLAYVVHEVPDQKVLFNEVANTMKKHAKVLFIEPRMHVKEKDWLESLRIARENGFELSKSLPISRSRAFELIKI